MGNAQLAQVLDTGDELLEEAARLLLCKVGFGSNVVEQFSVAAVLHDQEKALGCLDDFVQLNDGGVPNDLQDVDFSRHSFDVVDVLDFPLVKNLNRHFLPGVNVESLLDFSECALA